MHSLKEISVFSGMSPTELLSEITAAYLGVRPRVATDDRMDEIHRRLIIHHPCLRNRLFRRMLSGEMSPRDYAVFFSEYNWPSEFFYNRVLPAAKSAHDNPAWHAYIDHIIDEESQPAPHHVLFEKFMNSCGAVMSEPLGPAKRFAHGLMAGYTAPMPFAAGYALGFEVEAGYEIAVFSKGMRHHFADQLEKTSWFEVHIGGGQEDEHAMASIRMVEEVCKSAADLREVHAGFLRFCDDVHGYMEGISDAIDDDLLRGTAPASPPMAATGLIPHP